MADYIEKPGTLRNFPGVFVPFKFILVGQGSNGKEV